MKELNFKLHSDVLESNPNVNLNTNGGKDMNNVTMFNFKAYWNLVEPHLIDPDIFDLLNSGMQSYCSANPLSVRIDWARDGHKGPWLFSIGDCWNFTIHERIEKSREMSDLMSNYETLAEESGIDFNEILCAEQKESPLDSLGMQYWNEWHQLYESCLPQPSTYEWYQCLGAEKYLAPWQKSLAEKIFSDYQWKVFQTDLSCDDAYPIIGNRSDSSMIIFDIFSFERLTAMEILKGSGLMKPMLVA